MPSKVGIRALSLLLLVACSGCASTNLYVIDKQDFYVVPKGTQLGATTVDRDGFFLSNLYMEKVVEAKVKRSK